MKKKLRSFIAEGKTKKTIDNLLTITQQIEDQDHHKEVIMQSARYEKYTKTNRIGISSHEEEDISIAKINNALLDIIDNLPEEMPSSKKIISKENPKEIDSPPSGKWWKWIVALGLLITIPAGIAEITGYSIKDIFKPTTSSTASNTVTVLVHGKKGKDDLILPNRGIVKLIYGDAIVPKQINADGEATFKQISDVFFSTEGGVEIIFQDPKGEAYRAINSKTTYKLTKGKYIPLEVRLFGLGIVKGIVKDFKTGEPIQGARIAIQQKETFSNEHGEFILSLPEDKQQKFQTIRVTEEAYQSFELSNVPILDKKEIPILLKSK